MMKNCRKIILVLAAIFFLSSFSLAEDNTEEANKAEDKAEVSPEFIDQTMPAYKLTLKQIISLSEKYLKKVDEEINQVEAGKDKEGAIRASFDKATLLYKKGEIKGAQKEWLKVTKLANTPSVKHYVQWLDKTNDEVALRKEEEVKIKRQEVESRRLASERLNEEKIAFQNLERELKKKAVELKQEDKPLKAAPQVEEPVPSGQMLDSEEEVEPKDLGQEQKKDTKKLRQEEKKQLKESRLKKRDTAKQIDLELKRMKKLAAWDSRQSRAEKAFQKKQRAKQVKYSQGKKKRSAAEEFDAEIERLKQESANFISSSWYRR